MSAVQYVIPDYQRDYKWGETEAQDLIEDLDRAQDHIDEPLFLGTFIFSSSESGKANVIDGQQRITTLLLLLIACRMRASALGETNIKTAIQQKITWMDPLLGESSGCKLRVSESIRQVFDHIADANWNGEFPDKIGGIQVKRQKNRIKPIFDYFNEHLSTFNREKLTKFLKAVYETYVIVVSISGINEALQIFERTNARGMELEISDLLKNHLFSKNVEGISAKWLEIQENADGTIQRLLKYFYVSKNGYVLKADLYRRLKECAAASTPEIFTDDIRDFSEFYRLAKDPTPEDTKRFFADREIDDVIKHEKIWLGISHSLQALREFGVAQFIPLAYAAIGLTKRETQNRLKAAKNLLMFFEILEKYHFINNVVCERVGNEVERLYADKCLEFSESNDQQASFNAFYEELKNKLAIRAEFISRFKEISYPPPQRLSLVCYIFDRFVNDGLEAGQRLPIFHPDKRVLFKNHHIEHFLPKSAGAQQEIDTETRNSISNIGNLLPLYFKTNIQLSDDPPDVKAERLTGELAAQIQNNAFVTGFLQRYGTQFTQWDAAAIKNRAENLANEGYDKIWNLG